MVGLSLSRATMASLRWPPRKIKRYRLSLAERQKRNQLKARQRNNRAACANATREQKNSARKILRDALQAGRIVKRTCMVCRSPRTQAHHVDYRQPLAVVWLCARHHRREHGFTTNDAKWHMVKRWQRKKHDDSFDALMLYAVDFD